MLLHPRAGFKCDGRFRSSTTDLKLPEIVLGPGEEITANKNPQEAPVPSQ